MTAEHREGARHSGEIPPAGKEPGASGIPGASPGTQQDLTGKKKEESRKQKAKSREVRDTGRSAGRLGDKGQVLPRTQRPQGTSSREDGGTEIFQPVRLTGSWPPRQMPMQNLWSIAESMGQS